jgi:hypothetical protein
MPRVAGERAPAMNAMDTGAAPAHGPWHPGIESRLPRALLPLSTIFRKENVWTSVEHAEELQDFTGIDLLDLVAFRPERLLLHEVLIRVTADLSVPSGSRVEDLGINFRQMTSAILARHLAVHVEAVAAVYATCRRELAAFIDTEIATHLFAGRAAAPASARTRKRGWRDLFRGRAPYAHPTATASSVDAPAVDPIAAWDSRAHSASDPMQRAACRALARVVAALVSRHGSVWGTPELIATVATSLACNEYAGDEIGRLIEPHFLEAARSEGFAQLPAHAAPVIMNTKGASAAGKSTLRPEQKALAQRLGVDWRDFALISPDIWRKQLLDYASLGAAYKYGGACTGDELQIIDQKLDRYMARKAERHATTHLLIDRFRFDSFAADSDEAGSNLLTRFGHTVYLFFMITPPEEIVKRAWQRGLEVGRYKAVDDLLAHNIEAYAGMPELFFTWALRAEKEVHYEFLDNDVPYGERPRTAAFGWNSAMNVLDVKSMLDVQRFRRVDVTATGPDKLYVDKAALAPERNTQFLLDCARRIARLNFVEQGSGRIYMRLEQGRVAWVDADALRTAVADPDTRAGIAAVAPNASSLTGSTPGMPRYLANEPGNDRMHTLGRWGGRG